MIRIEKAGIREIPLIHQLAENIWPPAFAHILSPSQISYMMDMMYRIDVLEKQMQENHTFLVFYHHNEPGGYAAYAPKEENVFKLHKIYLAQDLQGRGFGKAFMQDVIERVQKEGASILELNVNRYNPAVKFYEKQGFSVCEAVDIPIGEGYFMNDYVMRKLL